MNENVKLLTLAGSGSQFLIQKENMDLSGGGVDCKHLEKWGFGCNCECFLVLYPTH